MPRHPRPAPNSYSPDWPETPCDDPTAEVARLLALRLREALAGGSLRAAKAVTGVDHTTISDLISGRVWGDVSTLARLEAGLAVDLWPGRGGVAKQSAGLDGPQLR